MTKSHRTTATLSHTERKWLLWLGVDSEPVFSWFCFPNRHTYPVIEQTAENVATHVKTLKLWTHNQCGYLYMREKALRNNFSGISSNTLTEEKTATRDFFALLVIDLAGESLCTIAISGGGIRDLLQANVKLTSLYSSLLLTAWGDYVSFDILIGFPFVATQAVEGVCALLGIFLCYRLGASRLVARVAEITDVISTTAEGNNDLRQQLDTTRFRADETDDVDRWVNSFIDNLNGIISQATHIVHDSAVLMKRC